jgi:hypothetical protein
MMPKTWTHLDTFSGIGWRLLACRRLDRTHPNRGLYRNRPILSARAGEALAGSEPA